MLTQYISLVTGAVTVSVKPDNFVENQYDLMFDGDNFHICIAVKADFLRKINNVLRNVCYPRESQEERVKVCLNATVNKSLLENTQSEGKTSAAVMASFLKSLRLEDVAFGGISRSSENTSQPTANSQELGILSQA